MSTHAASTTATTAAAPDHAPDQAGAPTSPAAPKPEPGRRCRALTVKGIQCLARVQRGHDLCYTHLHHRHPQCPPRGSKISLPLLEDRGAIQLLLTQIAHGVLSGDLNPAEARAIAYICQVALSTLPRLPVPKADEPAKIPEPVADVTLDPDGDPLGPEEKYCGPTGTFEPEWSISKYLYEQQCIRLGEAIPTCPEEYPECGWLSEEEQKEDPQAWGENYHKRIAALADLKKACTACPHRAAHEAAATSIDKAG